ncbi:primosomal protein [Oryzobacter terrae]|uniref:primosomal protein n=1 Tax=Oryzobacter terrae TaxID=1620385 RepID=UPI00366ED9BE
MSADPRAALTQLVAAFERHLEASSTRHGEDDPGVVAAYEDLADAFEEYDGALYDAYGEMTPLDIYSGDDATDGDGEDDEESDEDPDDGGDDELDDHDDEDGDDTRLFTGLDDDIEYEDDRTR